MIVTPMRSKDPGEGLLSAYVLRPVVWLAFNLFSSEARFLRRHAKNRPRPPG